MSFKKMHFFCGFRQIWCDVHENSTKEFPKAFLDNPIMQSQKEKHIPIVDIFCQSLAKLIIKTK